MNNWEKLQTFNLKQAPFVPTVFENYLNKQIYQSDLSSDSIGTL